MGLTSGDIQTATSLTIEPLPGIVAQAATASAIGSRELSYVEFTGSVASTSTTFAAGSSVVSAGALTFDGATKVRIEFFAAALISSAGSTSAQISLADGGPSGTDLGVIVGTANTDAAIPVYGVREFTPPDATKTYSAVIWVSASGTGTVAAGAGGAGTRMPGFIRISTVV